MLKLYPVMPVSNWQVCILTINCDSLPLLSQQNINSSNKSVTVTMETWMVMELAVVYTTNVIVLAFAETLV